MIFHKIKKKYYLTALITIWGLQLNAQEIEVSYEATAKIVENSNKRESEAFKKLAFDCNKVLEKVNFKSISNGELQRFFYEEIMTSDFDGEIWRDLALIWAMDGKQIYSDYTKSVSYYESNQISKIRSVNMDNIDWIITNDSKNILGYKCYLATAKIINPKEENKLTVPTIAWFCLKLTNRGGPTAYATLPGTILELESEKIKFTATKVEIKKRNRLKLPQYNSEDVLPHIEWDNFFAKNNPVSRLRN